ncbi:MAG: chromosomal replication initiator protein DnaA [Desulfobacca sp.]|nr:chromosomal replication initiator protein DnaA [Desulfobacca sp.]
MKDTFWQTLKERLKDEIPENQYRMWIEPMAQIQSGDQEFLLGCPNDFFLKWVRERYYTTIVQVAQKLSPNTPRIALQVSALQPSQLPSQRPQQFSLPGFDRKNGIRLNGGFTFDQFVTGPSNHFAYLASMALATDKDLYNNALYLFSSTGLGKTHLSQAVGNYINKHKPQARVLYLSAEEFTNEMVLSIKSNSMDTFKDKYRRNCDFLLLEEVNFLSGKETTQAELSFTLDALFNDNKKIIFTSSLPPKDIPRLGSKLKSRLNSALIGPIEPPDFETRRSIVDRKACFLGIGLPMEVKEFLASKPFKDMRQLEGCLIRMSAQATLMNQAMDLALAELVVEEQIQEKQEVSIQAIKDLVGKYFRVSVEEMISRSRKRVHLLPRNLSILLSKKYTGQTLETIGKAFNRDLTSVIYAVNSMEKVLKKNSEISKQVHFLSSQIERIQSGPSPTTH